MTQKEQISNDRRCYLKQVDSNLLCPCPALLKLLFPSEHSGLCVKEKKHHIWLISQSPKIDPSKHLPPVNVALKAIKHYKFINNNLARTARLLSNTMNG